MPVQPISIEIRYRNIIVKYRFNYLFYKSITLHFDLAVLGSYHMACSNSDFRFDAGKSRSAEDDMSDIHGLGYYPSFGCGIFWALAFRRFKAITLPRIKSPPIQNRQVAGSSRNTIPTMAVKITSLDMNTPPSHPLQ